MPKIRVAYLIDTISCETAGTERQLLETIRRLDRNRFEPFLICLYSSPWLEENEITCPVHTLGYKGFIKPGFPNFIKQFSSFLKEHQFHILQTFFEDSIFVAYFGSLFSRAVPVLLSSRRDIGLGDDRPAYHKLYKVVLPHVNRWFHGIVVNGEKIKHHTMKTEKVDAEKVKVIHNGIDIPSCIEPEPPIFRENPRDLWIGMTANLNPVKRYDIFLNALSLLKDKHPDLNFGVVILGEGREKERLMKMSLELGLNSRVHFLGSVSNVIGYLQRLDIGVLCSDKEGFPNAVLEYMACGLPAVVTATGGNTELVDETNGFCVPTGDSISLSEALTKLALNAKLRKKMGERSLEIVENRFSWNQTMYELQEYYKKIATSNSNSIQPS